MARPCNVLSLSSSGKFVHQIANAETTARGGRSTVHLSNKESIRVCFESVGRWDGSRQQVSPCLSMSRPLWVSSISEMDRSAAPEAKLGRRACVCHRLRSSGITRELFGLHLSRFRNRQETIVGPYHDQPPQGSSTSARCLRDRILPSKRMSDTRIPAF